MDKLPVPGGTNEGLPSRTRVEDRTPPRRWRVQLVLVGAAVFLTSIGVMAALFFLLDVNKPELKLDVIKVGLASGAGAGALVTLLLAIRRQLLAEEVADDARLDARERRVVDLFTKGLERLGADKEEVRVGGLYALERLADSEPSLREQVIDVVCTFLRANARTRKATDPVGSLAEACQNLLIDHLAYNSAHAHHKTYWKVELLSLSGAFLDNGFFAAARVDTMHFRSAVFSNGADFDDAIIRGANFSRAEFRGPSSFAGAWLGKGVFTNARFRDVADFRGDKILD